jgi:hypothetical protein
VFEVSELQHSGEAMEDLFAGAMYTLCLTLPLGDEEIMGTNLLEASWGLADGIVGNHPHVCVRHLRRRKHLEPAGERRKNQNDVTFYTSDGASVSATLSQHNQEAPIHGSYILKEFGCFCFVCLVLSFSFLTFIFSRNVCASARLSNRVCGATVCCT